MDDTFSFELVISCIQLMITPTHTQAFQAFLTDGIMEAWLVY